MQDTLAINEGRYSSAGDTPRDQRMRTTSAKRALKAGFMGLPKPENNFELLVPDEEETEEDAEALREEEERKALARRSQAVQRGLPRPANVDVERLLQDLSLDEEPSEVADAEKVVHEELAQLLQHDAIAHPLPGTAHPGSTRSAYEMPPDEAMGIAKSAVRDELAAALGYPGANEEQLRQGVLAISGQDEVDETLSWAHIRQQLAYDASSKTWVEPSKLSEAARIAGYTALLDEARQDMAKEASKATKAEKKLSITLGGYQARSKALTKRIMDAFQEMQRTKVDCESFVRLQTNENAMGPVRVSGLKEEVEKLERRERLLQERYAELETERRESQARMTALEERMMAEAEALNEAALAEMEDAAAPLYTADPLLALVTRSHERDFHRCGRLAHRRLANASATGSYLSAITTIVYQTVSNSEVEVITTTSYSGAPAPHRRNTTCQILDPGRSDRRRGSGRGRARRRGRSRLGMVGQVHKAEDGEGAAGSGACPVRLPSSEHSTSEQLARLQVRENTRKNASSGSFTSNPKSSRAARREKKVSFASTPSSTASTLKGTVRDPKDDDPSEKTLQSHFGAHQAPPSPLMTAHRVDAEPPPPSSKGPTNAHKPVRPSPLGRASSRNEQSPLLPVSRSPSSRPATPPQSPFKDSAAPTLPRRRSQDSAPPKAARRPSQDSATPFPTKPAPLTMPTQIAPPTQTNRTPRPSPQPVTQPELARAALPQASNHEPASDAQGLRGELDVGLLDREWGGAAEAGVDEPRHGRARAHGPAAVVARELPPAEPAQPRGGRPRAEPPVDDERGVRVFAAGGGGGGGGGRACRNRYLS
ncbi:hypothetical protein EVJ58_g2618 [Rhodofomes roseus]|uniref:Pre-mRNA splicing factor component Cdc5p/Cef1 C-terminal domain-containing protein n=1 Tax=Rhodofomes roseus TaxID=34475 RepID=A0A4Y9YRV9_9APHY|nr:hypothetical protein EVJ58_g2618 [Rhodofomes roseus]